MHAEGTDSVYFASTTCSTLLIFNQFSPTQNLLANALNSFSLKKCFRLLKKEECKEKKRSREGGKKIATLRLANRTMARRYTNNSIAIC